MKGGLGSFPFLVLISQCVQFQNLTANESGITPAKKVEITISNIYKIAEGYGWEVNITFKLKKV